MGEPPDPSEEEDVVWRELIRANDAVLVSAVQALLSAAKIPHLVLDQNMSVLEGSLGILPSATKNGTVKKTPLTEFAFQLQRGKIAHQGPRTPEMLSDPGWLYAQYGEAG